jgi:hypothetical protein
MGLLGGLFGSSSASASTTDQKVGVESGGNAFGAGSNYSNITISSDEVAQMAIASSTQALIETTDFLGDALTDFFNITDGRDARASENDKANNQLTKELLLQESQTADDRLLSVLKWITVGGVAIVAVRSGIFKEIGGIFK